MDLYPQQAKEFNRVHSFYEFLRQGRFTTTRCKDCGHRPFPPRVICPNCLSENLEWVDLPTRGKVKVVTEEEVGVPLGFRNPVNPWSHRSRRRIDPFCPDRQLQGRTTQGGRRSSTLRLSRGPCSHPDWERGDPERSGLLRL